MEHPARNTAGFTLIELMVALVISGIVAGVVFDLMLGQTRFARYQNAREEVQQNSRAALEVISSELRGVPPLAIMQADPNAIRYYLPRAWGILCEPLPAGSTSAWVRFPAGVFPAEFQTGSAAWGIAVAQATVPPSWQFVTTLSNATTANPCNANLQASGGLVDERGFAGGILVPSGAATPVAAGSQVFIFQEVAYTIGSSSVPGQWIRRASPANNPQPMAGPVPAGGLQFTYLDAAGNPLNPVVIQNIARVGVQVTTNSTARFQNVPQDNSAFTEVYLRNR
jgi:prepilin-type N-terminal cleavage/methylation domain-containing protein